MQFTTEQEEFWAGEFGDDYIERNQSPRLIASNTAMFARALRNTRDIGSCIEFGANIGLNLRALQTLFPQATQHAVEINRKAADLLSQVIPNEHIFPMSLLDFRSDRTWDLVLVKTVLIHIAQDRLAEAYDILHRSTKKYLLVCEYYNPSPTEVIYRNNRNVLFKRDFCGELLDRFADLRLLDYGFTYHRDPVFPQDDITWFLMEKTANL